MKLLNYLLLLTVVTPLYSIGTSAEEMKAEDEITYRQSAMMFMRWNMGKIKDQVVTQPGNYDSNQVIAAAKAIEAVADSGIGGLFSERSKTGKGWKKTRVKPEFFSEPEQVREKADAFKKESVAMVKAAQSGDLDQMKGQFDSLFKACKACHKKYREKD